MRVAISGASGFLGSGLQRVLEARGDQVHAMVRRSPTPPREIEWHPGTPLAPDALAGMDAVVHLAGENMDERWTDGKKQRIVQSRVDGTRNIATALAATSEPEKKTLVCASAVGYYGDRSDQVDEASGPGEGFLAAVCQAWEAAADPARDAGVRVVHIRTGMVLDKHGGVLARMLLPFRMGLGGPIGSGQQYFSWIAYPDHMRAMMHCLDTDLEGPVNLVGPEPVTNKEFVKALGRALGRPAAMPLPGFVVKTVFGQMGQEMLLEGQNVVPRRLEESGFAWTAGDLETALRMSL